MVEELEDKTDVIIALAHLGLDEVRLTSKALLRSRRNRFDNRRTQPFNVRSGQLE